MSRLVQEEAATSGAISLAEATAFIWAEAELLDRQDYKPWLSLWTQTGLYVIPIERDGSDKAAKLNIAYDDGEMRAARVKRLKSGFSISSAPSARTIRTMSRFVMGEPVDGVTVIRCVQMVVEYKFERTRVLGADVTYHLVRTAKGIRLERKELLLLNSDEALWGIGYLF